MALPNTGPLAASAPKYPVTATSWDNVAKANNPVFSPGYGGVFIPSIWSGKLIEKFYDATVLAAISNTAYEGEIRNFGDHVIIRTKSAVTIKDYEVSMPLSLERPTSNLLELVIDKGKYFAEVLDDVMEVQSDLNLMSMWADEASEQMKINIDTDVLDGILPDVITSYTNGVAGNSGNQGQAAGRLSGDINLGVTGTPLFISPAGTAANSGAAAASARGIMDVIVDFGLVLDEANIPETGRWIVMPSWMAAMIKRSELRDASLTGDGTSIMRSGRIGGIDRFTLYSSNLLPAGARTGAATTLAAGENLVIAGHSHGLTFASQLSKIETLRAESAFGSILRGLQIYGYKVLDGTAIAAAVVAKA